VSEIRDEIKFVSPDGGIVKITLGNFKESDVVKLKNRMNEAGWELASHRAVIRANPRFNWIFLGVILGIVAQTIIASIALGW
jgi:hypothetical protein